MTDPRIARANELIRNVPDFPKPGIQFKDIMPLLADAAAFTDVIDVLAERAPSDVEVVCGIESRGFLFAAPLAVRLGVGFVPIRKPGKLPGSVVEEHYDLEYGASTLAMHTDALAGRQQVLLVDDLLATGGTLIASSRLLARLGGNVVRAQVLIELADLPGRENLADAGLTDLYAMAQA